MAMRTTPRGMLYYYDFSIFWQFFQDKDDGLSGGDVRKIQKGHKVNYHFNLSVPCHSSKELTPI